MNKNLIYAAVGGLVFYFWWKNRQTSAPVLTTAINPATGAPVLVPQVSANAAGETVVIPTGSKISGMGNWS